MAHMNAPSHTQQKVVAGRGFGPARQFAGWAGLLGVTLAAYIYFKGQNAEEKRRIDAMKHIPGGEARQTSQDRQDGLPTRRRGGVGVSSASTAYTRSASAESHFLDANQSIAPTSYGAASSSTSAAYRPISLSQYRRAQAGRGESETEKGEQPHPQHHRGERDKWSTFAHGH